MANDAVVFSLDSVVDAITTMDDSIQCFANTKTGQIESRFEHSIFDDVEVFGEDGFVGEEWIALPDKWHRDDWGTMRDFAYEFEGVEGDELLDAIHGKGAFRAFRAAVERAGVLESWYAYRDEHFRQMAIEWLEKNHLAWTDDLHESMKRDWRALLPERLRARPKLEVLGAALSVCKLEELPAQVPDGELFFMARAAEEVSVVCETEAVPSGAIAREDGWRGIKVPGSLAYTRPGDLVRIVAALTEADIPVRVISTFDACCVLVKQENLDAAADVLDYWGCDVSA